MLNRACFCVLALALPFAASASEMVCPIGEIITEFKSVEEHTQKLEKATFNASTAVYEVHNIVRGYQIIGEILFQKDGLLEKIADKNNSELVSEIRVNKEFRETYARMKQQFDQVIQTRAPFYTELKFVDRLLGAQNCDEFRATFRDYVTAADTQLTLLEKNFGGTGLINSADGDYRDKVENLAKRCTAAGKSKLGEATAARTSGGDSDLVAMGTVLPKSRTMSTQDVVDRLEGEYMRLIKRQKNSKEVLSSISTYTVGYRPKESAAMSAQLAKMCDEVAAIEASVFKKIQEIDHKTLASVGIK